MVHWNPVKGRADKKDVTSNSTSSALALTHEMGHAEIDLKG